MNIIEKRISKIKELFDNIEFFETNQCRDTKEKIFNYFNIKKGEINWQLLKNKQTINLEDLDCQEVKDVLTPLSQHLNIVYILWFSDNVICKIEYSHFIQFYDDLWYPASDDILIVPADYKWIISIDHEEILKYGEVITN